ncbi:class I SAM-dependent methyltransferase [Polynucleobacter sinensis]|uniref:class I SAM-dependent methyltransferase n=1 Tax=Polynucleobacter sinensis TaxID=1743157 RepID=UPI0007866236|nr:methyltransferase domain-containing protein [Polynucleobacter sinensis]
MNKAMLIKNVDQPISRLELVKKFCKGRDVLDVGCVNHDISNISNDSWQHAAIKSVASNLLGIDYLESEVAELNKLGYRVIAADATKPIEIEERFDVVVVGNLIEHLSSFEGLFKNIEKLLKPGGCALISTANPFYCEQYFYSAFKNDIVVNQEHTCWLDPVTLDQLSQRFSLVTCEVHWVKEKWKLSRVIMNSSSRALDIYTGQWKFVGPPSLLERLMTPALMLTFKIFAPKDYYHRVLRKYRGDTSRLLYLRIAEPLFSIFWAVYRRIIVTSPLNQHELFVSVLKRKH